MEEFSILKEECKRQIDDVKNQVSHQKVQLSEELNRLSSIEVGPASSPEKKSSGNNSPRDVRSSSVSNGSNLSLGNVISRNKSKTSSSKASLYKQVIAKNAQNSPQSLSDQSRGFEIKPDSIKTKPKSLNDVDEEDVDDNMSEGSIYVQQEHHEDMDDLIEGIDSGNLESPAKTSNPSAFAKKHRHTIIDEDEMAKKPKKVQKEKDTVFF